MKSCPVRGGKPCVDDVCSSYGDDECPPPPPSDQVDDMKGHI